MKKHWWKALGALLIIYTLIMGLSIPMKPALVDQDNRTITAVKSGESVTLQATGYNTFFTKNPKIKAWLTIIDSIRNREERPNVYPIAATKITVADDTHLEAAFDVPAFLPINTRLIEANLVIETQEEGLLIRNTAVQIAQDSVNTEGGKLLWNADMSIGEHAKKGMTFPNLQLTRESIRNTFFHVPMWFAMFTLYAFGLFYSIQYLRKGTINSDTKAFGYTQTGTFFGVLGLITGGTWANYTWGEPFPIQEIKLLMTYTALAIYFAYFILRGSFDDFEKRARISAVYSIFSFSSLIPLLYVIPKLAGASNHPGNGGNSTIAAQDLDNTLRLVFYPASIGWILMGLWIGNLVVRTELLKGRILSR
ncbi:MAG: cytochrome c biogenesis protein CcsA [Saprospiraceae bacterium]|nr:cytochrome c biogenesis protein CcsA [Saprospiraceae bacterium]